MGIKLDIAEDSIEDEVARSYALNIHCEEDGHTWIPRSHPRYGFDGSGIIVNADRDGIRYTSSLYGRLERRSAFVLSQVMKRQLPTARAISLPSWLEKSQVDAINRTLSSPISNIIGGPGTGKTTIASLIVKAHGYSIGLSPTGKGADRLSESIKTDCYTIHRLYYNTFEPNGDTIPIIIPSHWPLIDLIIVDEMGMTGTDALEMLAAIAFKAKNARILMMGDTGQLPSVSPGSVLSEIMQCIPTSKLELVFRFDDYHIGMACEMARSGLIYNPKGRFENYEIFTNFSLENAIEMYRKCSSHFGTEETRLITFHTRDAWQINRRMAYASGITPVVCDKNNYRLNVFNGQTGVLKGKLLHFGTNAPIAMNRLLWSYAYASTCHKSQGSQWDCVIVWIPSSRYISPQWLNTAVSRPTTKLIVAVGNDIDTVQRSMKTNAKQSNRISLLADFVTGRAKWLSA